MAGMVRNYPRPKKLFNGLNSLNPRLQHFGFPMNTASADMFAQTLTYSLFRRPPERSLTGKCPFSVFLRPIPFFAVKPQGVDCTRL